jgi:hypothetical protein
MSSFDHRLPLKNYNQTTTKRRHIYESCDVYQSVSAEIGDIYEIMEISTSFRRPMLYPIELQAQALARV